MLLWLLVFSVSDRQIRIAEEYCDEKRESENSFLWLTSSTFFFGEREGREWKGFCCPVGQSDTRTCGIETTQTEHNGKSKGRGRGRGRAQAEDQRRRGRVQAEDHRQRTKGKGRAALC